ncbi:MerR family transcriptional regulator [Candidatus Galacturonibacter soehngenii]|uniref:MerR family transcriptional regulator n=1 Tax=Candidatus Galacturonatibacter soehngenii TaxID=2307010 RepID=A0A7V7QIJ0_9FIRM|nr:MerR family transcriptional regulator [Candidatus Galacturonibacter soehngenii]KAB1436003.1 MerR family transcriptional regulator [Candidatus Galacturonibacter soehngenii]
MELVKITELTNQLDISSRTLRYYEQIGLIQSERLQFEKYRFYDAYNIERIKQILILRKMQISIKEIIKIYESKDMTALVNSFVARIEAIENEIEALSELKQVIHRFMDAMLENGIKHISALPLLYETMEKQMESIKDEDNSKEISYERLLALTEQVSAPIDLNIVDLPPMRVITSQLKDTLESEVEGFWEYLLTRKILIGTPGSRCLFEYQTENGSHVMMQRVDYDLVNESPYVDYEFVGGLFAVGSVYVDDDLALFHNKMIQSFDDNSNYEVDYRQDGLLRHETLAESVISIDSQREKLNIYVPVKRRLPRAKHDDGIKQIFHIEPSEIEKANPILKEYKIPLTEITPIYHPDYKVLETNEAEFVCWITARRLSTNVSVRLPFRVDIEFKVDKESERFGYGSDEGSIRFYHGNHMYGINMENKADARLSKEAICFDQPLLGNHVMYPYLGKINYNEYNTLSWIVGEKHFAIIINEEVRYCGVNFSYMNADLYLQKPETIVIGSDGQGKKYFRSIKVSQLKTTPKRIIKRGELTMATKQSNNLLPVIHRVITPHYGENYWFNGCAKYVMECLGETDYDYHFFAGLTGDSFAQVYSYDHFRGDGATDYFLSERNDTNFIEEIFAMCGYASTFVTWNQLHNNKEMYLQTLIAYIDKKIPVIFNYWGNNPRDKWGWGVFVGYKDYGKTLLYMTSDIEKPEEIECDDLFANAPMPGQEACNGWIFVGEKRKSIELSEIYRKRILTLSNLLKIKTRGYCFGAEAFNAWAADIEQGKYDHVKPEEFDDWPMHTIYVCNLATNSSCCHEFLERARKLNPDLEFINDIHELYDRMRHMWNEENGKDLEAIGGGFNITLEALQNKKKRSRIVEKLREFARTTDRIVEILEEGIKESN